MKLLYTLLLSVPLFANQAFVSVDFVQKNLNNKTLKLIDVGTAADYKAGHILNAVNTPISDWRTQHGKHQLMSDHKTIQKRIESLGINVNDHVVLYGHNKAKENLKSSYIALALISHGFTNVSILDGHFKAFEFADDTEVSTAKVSTAKGDFKSHFNDTILVDKKYVLQHLNKIPMIEARPPLFYFGTKHSSGVKRIGHIKGAMSYAWFSSFKEGKILPVLKLKEILIQGMELKPSKTMLAYCTGGLEASMNWYVLTQVLHFNDVKIYDASMREWANLDDTPMISYRWEHFSN